jgi:hypothetical protein
MRYSDRKSRLPTNLIDRGDIKHSRADIHLSEQLLGDYDRAVFRDELVRTARWLLSASGRTKKCED